MIVKPNWHRRQDSFTIYLLNNQSHATPNTFVRLVRRRWLSNVFMAAAVEYTAYLITASFARSILLDIARYCSILLDIARYCSILLVIADEHPLIRHRQQHINTIFTYSYIVHRYTRSTRSRIFDRVHKPISTRIC